MYPLIAARSGARSPPVRAGIVRKGANANNLVGVESTARLVHVDATDLGTEALPRGPGATVHPPKNRWRRSGQGGARTDQG